MDDYSIYYDFNTAFLRVDQNNKVLKGEKYEIVSLDGNVHTGIFTTEEEFGDLHIYSNKPNENGEYVSLDRETLLALIPQGLKDFLSGVNNRTDVNRLKEYGDLFFFSGKVGTSSDYILTHIPFRLHNVKAANGVLKDDIILVGDFYISYGYRETGSFEFKSVSIELWSGTSGAMYLKDYKPINSIEDLSYYHNLQFATSCMNSDEHGMIIIDYHDCNKFVMEGSGGFDLVPYLVARDGEVSFDIENTVNGLAKYNASKDKNLEYKISITNNGNASSGENVITSYIPEELNIVENSISDNGVYDKDEHTITWNVDRIEAEQELEFSYMATAPDNSKGKEYVGKSSIVSAQVLGATYSNNTIVTLDQIVELIKNPETGMMVYIANTNIGMPLSCLVVVTILICMMFAIFIKKYKFLRK